MVKRCTAVVLLPAVLTLALACGCALAPASIAEPRASSPEPQLTSAPAVTLRAASGATIPFLTQNGRTANGVPPRALDIPHLVLHRNGGLAEPAERTLIVAVGPIEVGSVGVTVTLEVETQHGDPDLGGGADRRIPVWRQSLWIEGGSDTGQAGVTPVLTQEFGATVISGTETIATPSDYFRYTVTVIDAGQPVTEPRHTFSQEYGFLMENQWTARLPEVRETSVGAAPDQLVVYYCDMFFFQRSSYDTTLLPLRATVTDYLRAELLPQMIEAFRSQTDGWGFPWHDAWTSHRREEREDAERLSVALSDGRTWYHGSAPTKGHAAISIAVSGALCAPYGTPSDAIMSTFHHELFHNLQRNINLACGGDGHLTGRDGGWEFLAEGTAVMASSVGQPDVQFGATSSPRAYISDANGFLVDGRLFVALNGGGEGARIRYISQAAIYWRFLYEECGGMQDGVENPATGMQVINRTLTALYSKEALNTSASADPVENIPKILNQALASAPVCPFRTYEDSLIHFARAIYALRLAGGRCTTPGAPVGCGFYDPNNLYVDPPLSTITYTGTEVRYSDSIGTSFGIDLVDVMLDPAADGQPLTIEFTSGPGADAEFNVQVWKLMDPGGTARPQRVPAEATAPEVLAPTDADGHLAYTVPAIDTGAYNRLGLIITRLDIKEGSDPVGPYTLTLHAGVGDD